MLQYCLYDLVTAATRKEPAEKQTSQTTNLYLWLKQGIGWQRDWVDTTITVPPGGGFWQPKTSLLTMVILIKDLATEYTQIIARWVA